jgi:hypothetical protein
MKQTRQAVHAIKQTILLRCICSYTMQPDFVLSVDACPCTMHPEFVLSAEACPCTVQLVYCMTHAAFAFNCSRQFLSPGVGGWARTHDHEPWVLPMCLLLLLTGNTKGGSITVLLTSCLTGLDKFVLQLKTKIVSSHTADSKPVK